ncbi:hypothetical protein SAMN04489712_105263 [Thermomonospora echinospora]|uniref:Uncharacterized protein n=1 Tax=Thermomonospora echinospora TaxID=1992 RepID=A0A1H6A9C9_9ACTN|nr:hypothetical protein [Thermomonospora echinospora]SEG44657.1 hypothetical protein SAMN04489712_105263 [Thermomonospora echinospora]
MTDDPTPMSAVPELLALAAKTRHDIDQRDLEGAISDAITRRGWPWTLAHTAGMLARGEQVRDLRNAIGPIGRKTR